MIFEKRIKYVQLLFLLVYILSSVNGDGVVIESADVGELCSTNDDCGSTILYCSSNGVCLCDQENANFLYEFRDHFDIRSPKCEVRRCALNTTQDENGCNLHGAYCSEYHASDKKNDIGIGFCKCLGNYIGSRRPNVKSKFASYCQYVKISTVGEDCHSTSPVCDVNKKLICYKGTCECNNRHVFDFDQKLCIKKKNFNKLGQYQQYCHTFSDCNEDMSCINGRCDCPAYCSEEYIKTDELCYCPSDFPISLVLFGFAIAFAFLICILYVIHSKKPERRPHEIRGTLSIQGGDIRNRNNTPNEDFNVSTGSQTVHDQSGPPAGTINSVNDLPPSYDEAVKQSSHNQKHLI